MANRGLFFGKKKQPQRGCKNLEIIQGNNVKNFKLAACKIPALTYAPLPSLASLAALAAINVA
jgi:hypothetical protein